ncbi:zinc transporter ZntB [Vibrio sp. SM6]|uniref:Zinc transporter ZntB n=1 Tax=Vibrio agarilyticus TaxID=2726741 RepID=A0A7X8TS67_9VIBR|nr:zinc transporter ZntB [Vibrio agarilyticus]
MDFLITHWQFATEPPTELENNPVGLKEAHWYHCQRNAPSLRPWLESLEVPQSVIDSLLAKNTRPMFEQYDEHNCLLILRGMNLNHNAHPEDMPSLRLLYYHGALISAHKFPSETLNEFCAQLKTGNGPQTLEALMLGIIDDLNKNIDSYITELEDRFTHLNKLYALNKYLMPTHQALIKIKRFTKPQQYALEDFRHADLELSNNQHLSLRHSVSTITRLNDTIDFLLTEIEIIKGEIREYHAEKMNRNTYLLSVIAAVFLPTSFLTGLFGVNLGGIPGTAALFAFVIFCCALGGIFLLELWLLRRLGFLSSKPQNRITTRARRKPESQAETAANSPNETAERADKNDTID